MSPTTLYREGTDLDELLAELDAQYPGQVQVLEITHPREGGVLGFFARQRVGVHYRLAEAAPAFPSDTSLFDTAALDHAGRDGFVAALAAASGRARTAVLEPAADEAPDAFMTALAAARRAARHGSAGAFADGAGTAVGPAVGPGAPGAGGLAVTEVPPAVAAAAAAIAQTVAAETRAESAARALADNAVVASRSARPALGPDPETLAAALAGRASTAAADCPDAAPSGAGALYPAAAGTAVDRAGAGAPGGATHSRGSSDVDTESAAAGRADAAHREAGPRAPGSRGAAPAPAGGDADDLDPLARLGRAVDAAALTAAHGGVADPFAAMLAVIALRRPAPARRDGGTGADTRSAPETAFPHGISAADAPALTAAPQTGPAANVAVPSPAAVRAAALFEQRPPAYAPADPIGTDFAAAGLEVAGLDAERDQAPPLGDEPPLMTWATVDRSELQHGADDPQPVPPVQGEATAAPRATPRAQLTGTERRTDSLPWPIAQAGAAPAAEGPKIVLRRGARKAGPSAVGSEAAAETAPGRTLLLSRQAQALSDDEPAAPRSSSTGSGAQHTTPLALRRQLLEIGVPVDLVPADAVHTYAAIEQLVHALPKAPVAPSLPGEILVLVGASRDVVAAADGLLAGSSLTFETIWTFGCPAAAGTRRIPTNGKGVLSGPDQAREVAATARAERTGAVLIVIGTDSSAGREQTAGLIAAISPDAVWGAVEATRKPADTSRALAPAGRIDGVVVTGAERTASPATVWETGLPIAIVDGRRSTPQVWAVLLLDKLSELAQGEDAPCSGALC